jgi:hypothetical protein
MLPNPKGAMFPFNGDISGMETVQGDAWGPARLCVVCSLLSWPPSPPLPQGSLGSAHGQVSVSLI